jgi:hypothetical protein
MKGLNNTFLNKKHNIREISNDGLRNFGVEDEQLIRLQTSRYEYKSLPSGQGPQQTVNPGPHSLPRVSLGVKACRVANCVPALIGADDELVPLPGSLK